MKTTTWVAIGAVVVVGYFLMKQKGGIFAAFGAGAGGQPTEQKVNNPLPAGRMGVPLVTGASGTLQDIKSSVGISADILAVARQFGIIGGGDDNVNSDSYVPSGFNGVNTSGYQPGAGNGALGI